jgi:hypothetical protein
MIAQMLGRQRMTIDYYQNEYNTNIFNTIDSLHN